MKKKDVLDFFGGNSRTAEIIGVSPSVISRWGEDVPDGKSFQIYLLSDGRVPCKEIERKIDDARKKIIENESLSVVRVKRSNG